MLKVLAVFLIAGGVLVVLLMLWSARRQTRPARVMAANPLIQSPPQRPGRAEPCKYELVTNETAKGRGYVVRRLRDQKLLSWQFLPKEDGIQCLEVVGESYHREDLQRPGFAAGFPIKLVQEPENPVDHDAVAVRDASGKYQAGHLSRDDAPKILKRIRKGIGFRALVMWEVNIDGQRVSLRILLMDAGTQIKLSVPNEALSAWESLK